MDELRRIRIHLAPHSTFVVHSEAGRITACTSDDFRWLLDMDEREAAKQLRGRGATFVDLADMTTVKPARGYRSRLDRQ